MHLWKHPLLFPGALKVVCPCTGGRGFWELRFETAWRMGQWAEAAEAQPVLADAGRFPLFNQAICSCLKVRLVPVTIAAAEASRALRIKDVSSDCMHACGCTSSAPLPPRLQTYMCLCSV